MRHIKKYLYLGIFIILLILLGATSMAQEKETPDEIPVCNISNKLCLLQELEKTADTIENQSWKDKSYRELAKSYTYDGYETQAIAASRKIKNPDTRALTIRGIGFAAADQKWPKERLSTLFDALHAEAKTIDHPPSHAIALTYIAMAQAFAGDDNGAMKTAKSMDNDALRNKAFGETAEIQAERGDFNAAMTSISEIDTTSFQNKAYRITAKIFTQRGQLAYAYQTAQKISNAYQKAQALQLIVNHGNPEEE